MTPRGPDRPDHFPDPDLRDDALAELYRQAARDEPSPRHDAAILAAARAELARPQPSPRPTWWPRWRIGLSVAATVMLTTSLVLLVQREQARDAAVGEGLAARRQAPAKAESAPAAPQEAEASKAPPDALAPAPAAPRSPAARPEQDAAPATQATSRERAAATPPAGALEAPAAKAKRVAPSAEPAPAAAAPSPSPSPSQEMRRDAQASPPVNAAREAAPRSPEAWLADIRALLQAGRGEEARAALQAFRRSYPDHPLPADLEALR
jgi:hypothetical protein